VADGRNAWLVRLDQESLAALERTTGEPWITVYEPAHKLSLAFPDTVSGPVAVTALLFEDGDVGAAMAALRTLGASRLESHRSKYNHLVRFELDRARLTEAAALRDIAWLEPTPVYTANNDLAQWVLQTGVQDQRKVYDHGLRGQGQLVMTSDSGIRTNHEMFNDSTLAINDFGDYPTHRKIVAYKRGLRSRTSSSATRWHSTTTALTPAGLWPVTRHRSPAPAGAGWRVRLGSTSWTSAARPGAGCPCLLTSTSSTSRRMRATPPAPCASPPTPGARSCRLGTRCRPCRSTSSCGITPTT
jgi:hypothetical protein